MESTWRAIEVDAERAAGLVRRFGLTPVAARFLCASAGDDAAAERILKPESVPWPDPSRLPGMAEGAGAVASAIAAGWPMLVHGDYDVDGLMGSAILVGGLRALGGVVTPFIPSRFDGGYGLSETSLKAIREVGARLVITTDCGTNARTVGEKLAAEGVTLVVTDHHLPTPGAQPPGVIVNPFMAETHPDQGMCGAFIALQMVRQVAIETGRELPLDPFLRLAAIATVADVAPITAANRRVCKEGFRLLAHTPNAALAQLFDRARMNGDLRSHHVAFHIAPRFNAAGRMESASLVLDLLLEKDPARAAALIGRIEGLNRRRKALQNLAYEEADRQAAGQADQPVILAYDAGWHRGVVGPVAARLAETWRKSAFVVAVEGDEGTGSARGWGADNVSKLLAGSSGCLVRYGGHGSAAGFTVRLDLLEDLRAALASAYRDRPADRAPEPQPSFHRIEGSEVMDAWRALDILDPFGPGNPEPRVGLEGLRARGSRVVHDRHLIWDVEMDAGQPLSVIAWDGLRRSLDPDALRPSGTVVGRLVPEQRPGASPFYLSVETIF